MIKYLILMLYFTGAKACREKIIYGNSQAITDSHKVLALWFWFISFHSKEDKIWSFVFY